MGITLTTASQPSHQAETNPLSQRRGLFWAVRTRILLLYAVLFLAFVGGSIPLFRQILFARVDARVEDDLMEEMVNFRSDFQRWQQSADRTPEALPSFIDRYLSDQLPEDDNFLIVLIDGQFYRSNPQALPKPLRPGSPLIERWLQLEDDIEDERHYQDPELGTILYLAQPIVLGEQTQGTFVTAHIAAGEREEALEGVIVFMQVSAATVCVAFILAWMATGRVLKPVQDLAQTARSISESELKQRLPVQGDGEMAELAQTFNTMMDRLQSAFESQRHFISDASHELRTPITIVRGHLELMDIDDPDDCQETLQLVTDELDRMNRFVDDMSVLAKAERPDFLEIEAVELEKLTLDLYEKAKALGERDWQLDAQGNGYIWVDRQRLTQAMMNLANNAVQHTQTGQLIALGSDLEAGEVKFWVSDTGEGIAPADQQRIFERFARASKKRRPSEGAGLGLTIVRAIAEAHGGRIELFSQPDAGSTFTLILPIKPPREVASK